MAGLRAGTGHEQVLRRAGPAFPARLRRDLHAANELGRVRPLHQRCRGRRPKRPGRPRFRLAPRVGGPAGARPRAVPRHHVLKYRAVLEIAIRRMPMDNETVVAYLDRVGVAAPAVCDAAGLRTLHRAHQLTVPFENLSIHLADPISLDERDLIDKIVRRRRGGFCYELNGAFALLLEALGGQVRRVGARVYGEAGLGPPFDHLALIVRPADGSGPWLADVGFGSHSDYPLLLEARDDQDDPARRLPVAGAAAALGRRVAGAGPPAARLGGGGGGGGAAPPGGIAGTGSTVVSRACRGS